MARALAIAGLAVGLFALILQFAITIPAAISAGRSVPGALVFYFSFFTILTNMAAVGVHAASLFGKPAWFARPGVRAGVAVAIAVVMIVYAVVLSRLWQPAGLALLCDVLLHYVAPILYLGWWLLAGADGLRRLRDIGIWLIYPALYLVAVMLRAPFAHEVPYPFLDVARNGLASVAISATGVLALFVVLSLVILGLDRIVGRSVS